MNNVSNTLRKTASDIFSVSNRPTGVTLLPYLLDSYSKLPQQGDSIGSLHAEKICEAALLYIFTITLPEYLFINLIIYLVQIQSKANVFIKGIHRGFSGVGIVFVNPDFL